MKAGAVTPFNVFDLKIAQGQFYIFILLNFILALTVFGERPQVSETSYMIFKKVLKVKRSSVNQKAGHKF